MPILQFINVAAGAEYATVGKGLRSCTTSIKAVAVTHPGNDQRIVFIDSPGFDDTCEDDTMILKKISGWLART
jgi:GTPase Era involved in 16S rRNA processing